MKKTKNRYGEELDLVENDQELLDKIDSILKRETPYNVITEDFGYKDNIYSVMHVFNSSEVCAWLGGTESIFSEHITSMDDAKQKVANAIIERENGTIACSCCKKKINIKDVAGGFYAGRYCSSCWSRQYKEEAAKENYD